MEPNSLRITSGMFSLWINFTVTTFYLNCFPFLSGLEIGSSLCHFLQMCCSLSFSRESSSAAFEGLDVWWLHTHSPWYALYTPCCVFCLYFYWTLKQTTESVPVNTEICTSWCVCRCGLYSHGIMNHLPYAMPRGRWKPKHTVLFVKHIIIKRTVALIISSKISS